MSWDDADDLDDSEFPDESDDGDNDTVECPHCLRPVYEDAERCPGCGRYLSREDRARPARRPWWLVVGALVCIVVVIRWVTLGNWP
jgi:hypothetical protein